MMEIIMLTIALIAALLGVCVCVKELTGPDDENYIYPEHKEN